MYLEIKYLHLKQIVFKWYYKKTVIKICKKKITVVEKHMKLKDIKSADECFITGTAAEITPVRSIGQIKFNLKKNL